MSSMSFINFFLKKNIQTYKLHIILLYVTQDIIAFHTLLLHILKHINYSSMNYIIIIEYVVSNHFHELIQSIYESTTIFSRQLLSELEKKSYLFSLILVNKYKIFKTIKVIHFMHFSIYRT